MSGFRFRLQKVLDWRETQLALEQAKVEQRAAELAAVGQARAELDRAANDTESEVRRWNGVAGSDLAALGNYRLRVQETREALETRRAQCAQALAAQQLAMREA